MSLALAHAVHCPRSNRVAVVADGARSVFECPGDALGAFGIGSKAAVIVRDPEVLLSLLGALLTAGAPVTVGLRASDADHPSRGLGLSWVRIAGGAQWTDGRSMFQSPPLDAARRLALADGDRPAGHAALADLATQEAGADLAWRSAITRATGLPCKLSLGATAAQVLPHRWTKAAQKLQKGADWRWVRGAYYGGRVQCFKPGWQGDAAEFDLRSAYGWALARRLPDTQFYDQTKYSAALPGYPAWYDATVELSGPGPGPLPVRLESGELSWPTSGRHRGVWTLLELEQSGVCIVEVHRAAMGRWGHDLSPWAERWLEAREVATDPTERAALRSILVSLAGRLCQKPVAWALWNGPVCDAPAGAVAFGGLDCPAVAYPVTPIYQPPGNPMAGSYITAGVRAMVRPHLQRQDVLYTDTDSIHLPADAPPPANVGPAAGQWALKEHGPAHYIGAKRYSIGTKHVPNV